MRAFETEQHLSLKDLLRIVWQRGWVVALTAFVFAGAAVGFSFLQAPVYEGSAKLLVGQKPIEDADRSTLGSDIQGLQQIAQTVTIAVGSKPIAEGVIEQLNLRVDTKTLLENLSVEQVGDTQFVELTYTDSDPVMARKITNTIGDVAAERISESSAGASLVKATVWEYAGAPEEPVGPNPLRNGVLALGLGLMLGIGLAFLLEYLDDSWRSPEEVQRALGVPSFGIVPEFDVGKIRKLRGGLG